RRSAFAGSSNGRAVVSKEAPSQPLLGGSPKDSIRKTFGRPVTRWSHDSRQSLPQPPPTNKGTPPRALGHFMVPIRHLSGPRHMVARGRPVFVGVAVALASAVYFASRSHFEE